MAGQGIINSHGPFFFFFYLSLGFRDTSGSENHAKTYASAYLPLLASLGKRAVEPSAKRSSDIH